MIVTKVFNITIIVSYVMFAGPDQLFCPNSPRDAPIYIHKAGSGKPAVVFVSGMAHDHSTWKFVQDRVAEKTLTVSYDRAGLGKTPYRGEPKDIAALAKELNAVVKQAEILHPFILVGHSMGCQIIKKFASLYPQKVHGIAFVDPGYNEEKLRSAIPDTLWLKRDSMIKRYQMEFNAGQEAENKNRNQICEAADRITGLPDVPVMLYTATMVTGFPASEIEQQIKRQSHVQWLKDMPAAEHIFVSSSWHYIHTDTPQVVISGVEKMLSAAKKTD